LLPEKKPSEQVPAFGFWSGQLRKMKTTIRRTFLPAVCLATVLTLGSKLCAESPLNQLMSGSSVSLLNSVRPHLVSQFVAPSSTAAVVRSGSSRFQPSGNRLIVARVVHALSSDPAQENKYLPAIQAALTSYEQQAAASDFHNDVAAAMALFLASAELGYRGTDVTEAQSNLLARQLQAGLDTPEMRAASNGVKQELYEFFATFGLYLIVTRQIAIEGHNASAIAGLKPLAGEALRWLLQVPPESIFVSDRGLKLAPGASAPAVVGTARGTVTSEQSAAAAGVAALVGIWHGVGISSTFTSTTNAAGTGVSSSGITSSLRGKDIAFLANGWFTSVIPSSGLTGVDAAKASVASPYYWGRYTFDGHHGTINFVAGGLSPFDFVDGKIIYNKYEFGTRKPIQ
jgi:hypothetical protein